MWLLITNPSSGSGKGAKIGLLARAYLADRKIDFVEILEDSQAGSERALITVLSTGRITAVFLVGGDGFIHQIVQHLIPRNIPLCVLPAGTGNDFARTLGYSLDDYPEIIENALKNSAAPIDVGRVGGEYFVNILSTGFDSLVNERANRIKWIRGPMKYNVAMVAELPLFSPLTYHFTIDGVKFSKKAMLIAVANGISYGGGMKVCPNASWDDGLFDIMILEPVSKLEFLRVFPRVFKGTHITHPQVTIMRGKLIEIESEAIAYADGERVGPLPVKIESCPGALLTWKLQK